MTASCRDPQLRLLYAGSLESLVRGDIIPMFEGKTRCSVTATGGGSRELAQAVREGRVAADVLLSADSEVIEAELVRSAAGSPVSWYFTFAANSMALVLGGKLRQEYRQRVELTAQAAAHLLRQGLRVGRSDPEKDPQGYRAVIVVQLLERALGERGLLAAALGDPRNSDQIVPSDQIMPMLRGGDLDLAFAYRSHAVEEGLPFADLPEAVNLGSPHLADEYGQASYHCTDGTIYRGRPITYAAALLGGEQASCPAAAFLAFLGSEEVRDALRRRGFGHVCRLEVPPAAPGQGGARA